MNYKKEIESLKKEFVKEYVGIKEELAKITKRLDALEIAVTDLNMSDYITYDIDAKRKKTNPILKILGFKS